MRVLISPDQLPLSGDGAYNMALDKVLFEAFDYLNVPSLRFYCFDKPTITIPIRYDGVDLCPTKIAAGSIKLTRRISGGKYLLHQLGLTYALYIPKTHLSIKGLSLKESYRRLSYPIFKALKHLNSSVDFLRCVIGGKQNKDCARETEVESMGINGVKFVGAAQKRGTKCIIQHGEIQLLSSLKGLGCYLRDGITTGTLGLDTETNLSDFKTSTKIVCQPESRLDDKSRLVNRLREKVASLILIEYEKVFGERHYHQLESTLINRAVECRKEFEVVLK